MPTRAEQYRHLASECRRVANTLSLHDRKTLLDMAAQWDRLADQQESATKLGQQQQQIRPKCARRR
jgi:hypothetical protein